MRTLLDVTDGPRRERDRTSVAAGGPRALAALAVVALLAMVGCSDERPKNKPEDLPAAYAEVIRFFVERADLEDETPTVFVEPLGEGLGIGLDTQASIVSATEEFADVRFIDDRSEALDDEGVRDDGIFLGLGPAVMERRLLRIDVDEIRSDDAETSWAFELEHDGDQAWVLTSPPHAAP